MKKRLLLFIAMTLGCVELAGFFFDILQWTLPVLAAPVLFIRHIKRKLFS